MIELLLAQLEPLRAQIAALKVELDALEQHARSRAEVDRLVAQQVETWRAQASAHVAVDLQRMLAGQPVELLTVRAQNGMLSLGPWMVAAMGEKAMTAWFKSLTGELPEGLDAPQRTERAAAIRREMDQAAVAEEKLLREAEEAGHVIDPRPDADPRAALIEGFGA